MARQVDVRSTGSGAARLRQRIIELLSGGRLSLILPIAGAAALFLYGPLSGSAYWNRELTLIAVSALLVSGINLSFGYAGEIQFGQVFMFALGSYLTMILAVHGFAQIIPLVLIGGISAALVGFIIALPALRFGGWSLAMTSFFLVITVPDIVSIFSRFTGGLNGLVDIPVPSLFGTQLGETGLYEVTIAVLILWLTCFRNLVTSRYGVIFRSLRESPVLTSSLGFSPLRLKALAFSLGAAPAGMAGCLFGFISLVISPSSFDLNETIGLLAASILGGVSSVYGAVIAAAALQLGPQTALGFADWQPVMYGAALILLAIGLRGGLSGIAKGASRRLVSYLARGTHFAPEESFAAGVTAEHGISASEAGSAVRSVPRLWPLAGAPLAVSSVSKSYGGVRALDNLSFVAQGGQVTGLIGSNGSGKTTLLNVICGYVRADQGHVTFGASRLTDLPAWKIASSRVSRTFQTPSVPRDVSVLDVVSSGRFHTDQCGLIATVLRLPKYRRVRRADREEGLTALEVVGLAHLADREAGELSLGTRRLVEVARSLCAHPGLILLDEPASGLSEDEINLLGKVIQAASAAGATVILVEHNFSFVTRICDVVNVLHQGCLIASGSAGAVAADPAVIVSYLGEKHASPAGQAASDEGHSRTGQRLITTESGEAGAGADAPELALQLQDAVSGYRDLKVLRGVSIDLRRGQIEVVLGRNGVGKTTLMGSIAGLIPLWEGRLLLDGHDVTSQAPSKRAARGIALVQEGKRIFHRRPVLENVVLGSHSLKLQRSERRQFCESILDQFPVLKPRAHELAGRLSGGQQQMLAIAQALASRPKVLLLDEPSAGLAPSIVDDIFSQIRSLSDAGMTVLLVEQVAEQALRIGDHVSIINDGQVVASGAPDDFSHREELYAAYFGSALKAPR